MEMVKKWFSKSEPAMTDILTHLSPLGGSMLLAFAVMVDTGERADLPSQRLFAMDGIVHLLEFTSNDATEERTRRTAAKEVLRVIDRHQTKYLCFLNGIISARSVGWQIGFQSRLYSSLSPRPDHVPAEDRSIITEGDF